jgi:subtilisin family serine protease
MAEKENANKVSSLKLNPYSSFDKKNYKLDDVGNLYLSGSYGDYDIKITDAALDILDHRTNKQITSGLKDVRYLNFNDTKKIPIQSNKSFHVGDIIKIEGAGPYIIKSEQLLSNDFDLNQNSFTVHKVLNPVGGTVSKKDTGEIVFIPNNSYKGIKSFEYHIKNSQGIINQSNVKVYLKTKDLPDDANFFDQWYLERSNIIEAWNYYTGKGVTVAVFDEGVIVPHKDIIGNIESVAQFSTIHGYMPIYYLHALGVSGVIAAQRNDINLVGVAYDAKIASYQLPFYDFSNINLDFFKYYSIINNSWGGASLFYKDDVFGNVDKIKNKFYKAYKDAVDLGRDGLGSAIVFAAGNSKVIGFDANYDFVTNSPYVIVVGGINKPNEEFFLENNIQKFASTGASILVSAPASHFLTLNIEDLELDQRLSLTHEDIIKKSAGTSFAAPLVSGVIALMLEANPKLGWRDIQEILAISAKKFNDKVTGISRSDIKAESNNVTDATNAEADSSKWFDNAAKNWNGGGMHYSREYGFGEVDAYGAVKLAESWNLKQTSNNMLTIANASPKIIRETIKAGSLKLEFNIEEDMIAEYLTLNFDLFHKELGELEVNLYSPAATKSTLLYKPGKGKELDLSSLLPKNLSGDLSSANFRGEKTLGKWIVEINQHSSGLISNNADASILGYLSRNNLESIDLTIYGKDRDSTTLYYTDEFTEAVGSNSQRSLISDNKYKTINAAAVSGAVVIDLSSQQEVLHFIGNHNVLLVFNKIQNLITGDGNDKLTGNDRDNIFSPGRGNNSIHTGGGNDIIYFANILTHRGLTTIDDFSPTQTKLQFGRNASYQDISPLVSSFNDNKDTIIQTSNWAVLLTGVDSSKITESNFIFTDLMI